MHAETVDSPARRVEQLDGLRGIAAVLVFSVHFISLLTPALPASSATARAVTLMDRIAHSGTDLFFIVSGFLVYGMLIRKARPMGQFLLRRFDRIYPAFAVMLGIYLVLSIAMPEVGRLPASAGAICLDVLMNLLLLPGIMDVQPIITVSWSLSYLLVFYLAAPLLIASFNLRGWTREGRVLLLVAMVLAWFAIGYHFGWHIRFVMFMVGMLVYEVSELRSGVGSTRLALVAGSMTLLVMLVLPQTQFNPVFRFVAIAMGYGCIVLCSLQAGTALASALRRPRLVAFGRMSLSYFLTHGLALKIVGALLSGYMIAHPSPVWFWVLFVPAFGLSLLLTRPLYLWIEQRSSRIGRISLPKWAQYRGFAPSARDASPTSS